MFSKILTAASAGAALIVAAPLFAQAHGGPGGNSGGAGGPAGSAGSTASMHSQGPMNASPNGMSHASPNSVLNSGTTTTTTTSGSQGLQHASPTGIAHANSNSALARGAVSTTTLTGLNTGLTVQNSSGTSIGTVSQIITGPNDTIRAVVVTEANGQTVTLPANSLSISNGVVTTTSTFAG